MNETARNYFRGGNCHYSKQLSLEGFVAAAILKACDLQQPVHGLDGCNSGINKDFNIKAHVSGKNSFNGKKHNLIDPSRNLNKCLLALYIFFSLIARQILKKKKKKLVPQ